MLYRTEFTYGAKIVERGMKVLDAINTQKETEKQGLKRKVLINEKNRNIEGLITDVAFKWSFIRVKLALVFITF